MAGGGEREGYNDSPIESIGAGLPRGCITGGLSSESVTVALLIEELVGFRPAGRFACLLFWNLGKTLDKLYT